jgi:hypothetical protein
MTVLWQYLHDLALAFSIWLWKGLEGGAVTVISAFLGFGTLTAGALLNARLTRRRDRHLADGERSALEAALYYEMDHLKRALARAGAWLASAELGRGSQRPLIKIDRDLMDHIYLPDFDLYQKLSGQIGKLSADCAAKIVVFYSEYATVRHILPKLAENETRRIQISPAQVLSSVVTAVEAAQVAQEIIAKHAVFPAPTPPDISSARLVVEMEEEAYRAAKEDAVIERNVEKTEHDGRVNSA